MTDNNSQTPKPKFTLKPIDLKSKLNAQLSGALKITPAATKKTSPSPVSSTPSDAPLKAPVKSVNQETFNASLLAKSREQAAKDQALSTDVTSKGADTTRQSKLSENHIGVPSQSFVKRELKRDSMRTNDQESPKEPQTPSFTKWSDVPSSTSVPTSEPIHQKQAHTPPETKAESAKIEKTAAPSPVSTPVVESPPKPTEVTSSHFDRPLTPTRDYQTDYRPRAPGQFDGGERRPYDHNRPRPPYDPDRPRPPFDPNKPRPPFDPDRPRPPYDPNRPRPPYDPDRPRPPFDPDRPRPPFDPNRPRPPYDPNRPRPPYDPNRPRPPYDPDRPRPPFDPNRPRPPYDPDRPRPPFDPNRPRPPYDPNRPRPPFDPNRPRPSYDPNRPRPPFDPNRPPRAEGQGGYGGNESKLASVRLGPFGASSDPFSPARRQFGPSADPKKKGFSTYRGSQDSDGSPKFDGRSRRGDAGDEDDDSEGGGTRRRGGSKKYKMKKEVIAPDLPTSLSIRLPISLKDLASYLKKPAAEIVKTFLRLGKLVTLNHVIEPGDEVDVTLIGSEHGCEITIDTSEEEFLNITELSIDEEIAQTDPNLLYRRPPIITFMGHVDHGKTSLIDAIRKSDLAAAEAGAITQHIGAFRCHTQEHGDITIIDTPGHEAFNAMRQRGANVTDVVILVIDGIQGIQTQTKESINQAQTAGASIIIAINKCDKPGFDSEKIFQQLASIDLLPEAWGGSITTVNTSAVTKEGLGTLLEMAALQSDILDLKADPAARPRGTVIESQMLKGLGATATVIVRNGNLRVGDSIVFDSTYAVVKTMHDEAGVAIEVALPSTPVKITGLSSVPSAGEEFIGVESGKLAKKISDDRADERQRKALSLGKNKDFAKMLKQKSILENAKVLNVIIRTDKIGSFEALCNQIAEIKTNKVVVNVLSRSSDNIKENVGAITPNDVEHAAKSGSLIIGFNNKPSGDVTSLSKEKKVKIIYGDIIHHITDAVRAEMKALLPPLLEEHETGEAQILQLFSFGKKFIAGCVVKSGKITRNSKIRLIRNKEVIWTGGLKSLKREKEDLKEVREGFECGIVLEDFNDLKQGDTIQAFTVTEKEQEL